MWRVQQEMWNSIAEGGARQMSKAPTKTASGTRARFSGISLGIAILAGFTAVTLYAGWSARSHNSIISTRAGLALICFAFAWVFLSTLQVGRWCRKLGLKRAAHARFLFSERSDDPDEQSLWFWDLQLGCAVLAMVVCVAALSFFGA